MRKDYETPKAEKLEFDYAEVVTSSGKLPCVKGMRVTYEDAGGNKYEATAPGDE